MMAGTAERLVRALPAPLLETPTLRTVRVGWRWRCGPWAAGPPRHLATASLDGGGGGRVGGGGGGGGGGCCRCCRLRSRGGCGGGCCGSGGGVALRRLASSAAQSGEEPPPMGASICIEELAARGDGILHQAGGRGARLFGVICAIRLLAVAQPAPAPIAPNAPSSAAVRWRRGAEPAGRSDDDQPAPSPHEATLARRASARNPRPRVRTVDTSTISSSRPGTVHRVDLDASQLGLGRSSCTCAEYGEMMPTSEGRTPARSSPSATWHAASASAALTYDVPRCTSPSPPAMGTKQTGISGRGQPKPGGVGRSEAGVP